jgi:hypothetical protein
MRRFVLVASFIAVSLVTQARAGDNQLTLISDKLFKDSFGFVNQTLSVKNNTGLTIEAVDLECGFLLDKQLMATGINHLKNLKPGETAHITVIARLINIPDHADCRAFSGRTSLGKLQV